MRHDPDTDRDLTSPDPKPGQDWERAIRDQEREGRAGTLTETGPGWNGPVRGNILIFVSKGSKRGCKLTA